MKALRTFFMEDWLETFRLKTKYNMGESGGRFRTTKDLILHSGYSEKEAFAEIMNMPLYDSPNRGREDLRKLVATMHPGAHIDNVLITTGTSEALFLLFRHLNPKKVALPLPAFQLLYEIPIAMGAKIIPLPIRYDKEGKPFVDALEWKNILTSEMPDCILINNPHNPSGLIFSDEQLEVITNFVNANNCYLIGDEHYRFLSSDNMPLGQTLYQNNSKVFVTGSFIKCFGTPGLRIGWCIGNKKSLDVIQNEKNYTTHTVNPFSEWMAVKVLSNPQSNLFAMIKNEWKENKQILKQFLSYSKTLYGSVPAGGLVTVLGFKNLLNEESLLHKFELLFNNGIFILPLSSMELGQFQFQHEISYKNYELSLINKGFGFRLGLGISPKEFQLALNKIEDILLANI